jgi:F-type H+-transporting ATPase subunit b
MEAFEINIKILIAQIINFSVILFVLAKYAYKPILVLLEKRKQTIAEGLENAENAKKELAKSESKAQSIIDDAYAEAKKIADESKTDSKKSANEIIEKANLQAEQIIKAAKNEADAAKDKALAEAKGHLSELVILSLEKIVGNHIDKSQREKLTAKAIEEL